MGHEDRGAWDWEQTPTEREERLNKLLEQLKELEPKECAHEWIPLDLDGVFKAEVCKICRAGRDPFVEWSWSAYPIRRSFP